MDLGEMEVKNTFLRFPVKQNDDEDNFCETPTLPQQIQSSPTPVTSSEPIPAKRKRRIHVNGMKQTATQLLLKECLEWQGCSVDSNDWVVDDAQRLPFAYMDLKDSDSFEIATCHGKRSTDHLDFPALGSVRIAEAKP